LRVRVGDGGGGTASNFIFRGVAGARLVLTAVPFSATVGAPLTAVVANFSDRDPQDDAADYVARIDWGDSAAGGPPDVTTGVVRRTRTGTFTVAAQGDHTYAAAATYTVTITLQDSGAPVQVVSTVTVTG